MLMAQKSALEELRLNKLEILLIDDDPMMCIYFRDIFWIHGGNNIYNVNIANTLTEAEDVIQNEKTRPSVIFMDIMIPTKARGESLDKTISRNFSFIEKIKKDPELYRLKVVIYSSQNEKIIRDKAEELGVDGYIVKGEMMPKEIISYVDKMHEYN
jgi:DNA-binding NarL/FixJ family response regulator